MGARYRGVTAMWVTEHDTKPTWATLTAEWSTALRAVNRSEGTIRNYVHYTRQIARRCPDPLAVGTADLQAVLACRRWGAETRKNARAAMVAFYRWAHASGYVERDPTLLLAPVSVPPGVPRPIPEPVLQRSLMSLYGRERLMVLLGAYAGLRASEIAQVRGSHLDDGILYVTGKGGKVRRVPIIHVELLAALERVGDDWLFPNGRGTHLSPGHVTRLLSNVLPDHWTAHPLRHRMATTGYAATHDLLAVGRVLGHSRPETTQRYTLVPDDSLLAVVRGAA